MSSRYFGTRQPFPYSATMSAHVKFYPSNFTQVLKMARTFVILDIQKFLCYLQTQRFSKIYSQTVTQTLIILLERLMGSLWHAIH